MAELTQLIHASQLGGQHAQDALYALIYPELRRLAAMQIARHAPHASVTPTVLLHEVYLKLAKASALEWQDRKHFYACCANAMRQILVDFARAALSGKRGGKWHKNTFTESLAAYPERAQELVDVDNALVELKLIDSELGELVELKFFGGLSSAELASLRKVSQRTIKRHWSQARALLKMLIEERAG